MKKITLLLSFFMLCSLGITTAQISEDVKLKQAELQEQQKLQEEDGVKRFIYPANIPKSQDELLMNVTRTEQPIHTVESDIASGTIVFDSNRMIGCDGSLPNYANSTATGGTVTSQDFEPANDIFDNQAADDFVVPGVGNATICQLSIVGTGAGIPADPANMVVMEIWSDAAGLPGGLLYTESFPGTDVDPDGDGIFTLNPSIPTVLAGGTTYWMSIYAEMGFGCCGQWFWGLASDGNGNNYAWQNPGNGFGLGCTVWTDGTTCVGGGPDLLMDISFNSLQTCGIPLGQPIPAVGTSGPMDPSIATVTNCGIIGTNIDIDNVELDLNHTFDGDLDITLTSPSGTVLVLADQLGGAGQNYTNTVFQDGFPNITTGAPPFTGTFEPEGGTFAATFAGENVGGDWTLNIFDNFGGDSGTLNNFCINFVPTAPNNAPVINCPTDIIATTDPGVCTSIVNFADAVAIDLEDGVLPVVQTMGPASGTAFPLGLTVVEFTATDSCGATSSCQFTVTVNDDEDPVIACQDITVQLDANGDATINATDLLASSSDNCGIATVTAGSASSSGSLTTTFASNNGQSGNMFDIMAINNLTIDSFDINMDTGVTDDVEVYFKTGTWVGSETNSGDWTLVGTTNVTSLGTDNPTPLNLSLGINVTAGQTVAFYVTLTGSTSINYTNGSATGSLFASDANLEFYEGSGKSYPFGGTFQPRVFNGNIIYSLGGGGIPQGATVDFDCSNVGVELLEVIVTDNSGNSSTCLANVTVEDNIAPIIACVGQPFNQTDNASDAPGLAIPDNDVNGISTIITIAADETILDLDVNLEVSHTWVGDLAFTLESPAGTQVTFFDRPGEPATTFGCSGDDIDATLDDEASDPVEDECDGGVPTINGTFIPNNPLSAFDGESSMGDWILTAVDNAGGDLGTIDEWSIDYTYEVIGTPLDITLDASGNASIPASLLLASVDEACGWAATVGGGTPTPCDSSNPSNGFENGRGCSVNNNWTAANDVIVPMGLDMTLTQITPNIFMNPGANASSVDVTIYDDAGGLPGAVITSETVVPTSETVLGSNFGFDISAVVMDLTPVLLPGDPAMDLNYWVAIQVTTSDGGSAFWEDSTATAVGNPLAFSSGGAFSIPNPLADGVYTFAAGCVPSISSTLDVTCDDLGISQIEVTVTDDSGNTATCTATVNVIDDTAPVITCGGPDLTTGASDSPALAIIDNSTVSTTLNVADDVMINDLDLELDINHTWTGDMQITLESPAGTQALVFDGGNDGCSADDLITLLDDESANALVCNPGGDGNAFPEADYMPSNPLSVFDGEMTGGDWIIYIEDTVGGDQGTLNSFTLFYSYTNPSNEVTIELDENGEAQIDAFDIINSVDEACGISTSAVDIDEFFCSDIGIPMVVTAFVSDASGNIAACTATVNVVDLLGPAIDCPADQTVDPGAGNVFYTLPDYFATGEATVADNCTDPVTITSQDPVPGTLLADGVYTITLTSEDEYGNVGTCSFELTVESVLGVQDQGLGAGIAMYPNPAREFVMIANSTDIAIEGVMIYDNNGRLVQRIDMNQMTQGERRIDVSSLASGIYMVQIQGETAQTMKRLLKE